jgi:hypothetical protein
MNVCFSKANHISAHVAEPLENATVKTCVRFEPVIGIDGVEVTMKWYVGEIVMTVAVTGMRVQSHPELHAPKSSRRKYVTPADKRRNYRPDTREPVPRFSNKANPKKIQLTTCPAHFGPRFFPGQPHHPHRRHRHIPHQAPPHTPSPPSSQASAQQFS